jgi:sugar/nucleoside kinase (ribokinase family)
MQALFIGQTYIDVTFLTDRLPIGDEKHVASDYAISFGGNAVTAAFCCAKLSIVPDLIASLADDWLGRMFLDMAAKYSIPIHRRSVETSSLSFIMPKDGRRAIVRCRDDNYLTSFPVLDLAGCRALHLDGHQADAALHYAQRRRSAGILTSLDGGGIRSNIYDLLAFIDVAVVAERLCQQMRLTPPEMLSYLKTRGCRIGGITLGEQGLIWYTRPGRFARSPRSLCRPGTLLIPAVPETSFMAHMCIHIWQIQRRLGTNTFGSHEQPPRTRSSTSATRRAYLHWPMSKRFSGNSETGFSSAP